MTKTFPRAGQVAGNLKTNGEQPVVVNQHVEFNGYTAGPEDADRLVRLMRAGVRQELARRAG